jgi:hypothetical protein
MIEKQVQSAAVRTVRLSMVGGAAVAVGSGCMLRNPEG